MIVSLEERIGGGRVDAIVGGVCHVTWLFFGICLVAAGSVRRSLEGGGTREIFQEGGW